MHGQSVGLDSKSVVFGFERVAQSVKMRSSRRMQGECSTRSCAEGSWRSDPSEGDGRGNGCRALNSRSTSSIPLAAAGVARFIAASWRSANELQRRARHQHLSVPLAQGKKYAWVSSKENVEPKRRAEFGWLRRTNLKGARAWAIKTKKACGTCGRVASRAWLVASSVPGVER